MKTSTKNNLIAILIVSLIALSGLLYIFFSPDLANARSASNSVLVDLPMISTQVISKDGESHSVDASISLEFVKDSEIIDNSQLNHIVKETISSLEYEKITEPGNITYIKDEVIAKLGNYVNSEDLLGVYVSELQTGDYRIASPPQDSSNQPKDLNSAAKNLFKKLGD